jgi:hypothetical protein
MTLRHPLLTAALAFGLLLGCSRNTPDSRPAESGGTPSAPMEPTPGSQPAESPGNAVKPSDEMPSGGTAAKVDAASTPAVYFVKDSGVRCIAAPCPSFLATRADRPNEDALKVTDVDLSALGVNDEKRAGILQATHGNAGLKVEATVQTVPNAGPGGAATVLRVSKLVEQ